MTGDITLGENEIVLDETLSGDETWSGITMPGTLGGTVTTGDLVYMAADGDWEKTDGILDGTDTSFALQLGICLAGGVATNSTTILLQGKIRSAQFPAFTSDIGKQIYMSDTAGLVTATQPVTANHAIRVIGFAQTAEDLYFNPSQDYIVHV
jgi:hypothetical protein